MKSRKEVAVLAALLAVRRSEGKLSQSHAWGVTEDTMLICRIATSASTIAVALSNGWIEQDQFERKKERLLKRLEQFQEPYKVRFEIGGDPRGWVLRMFSTTAQPIKGNTLGGDEDGYGI
jgi:hypothetical protein